MTNLTIPLRFTDITTELFLHVAQFLTLKDRFELCLTNRKLHSLRRQFFLDCSKLVLDIYGKYVVVSLSNKWMRLPILKASLRSDFRNSVKKIWHQVSRNKLNFDFLDFISPPITQLHITDYRNGCTNAKLSGFMRKIGSHLGKYDISDLTLNLRGKEQLEIFDNFSFLVMGKLRAVALQNDSVSLLDSILLRATNLNQVILDGKFHSQTSRELISSNLESLCFLPDHTFDLNATVLPTTLKSLTCHRICADQFTVLPNLLNLNLVDGIYELSTVISSPVWNLISVPKLKSLQVNLTEVPRNSKWFEFIVDSFPTIQHFSLRTHFLVELRPFLRKLADWQELKTMRFEIVNTSQLLTNLNISKIILKNRRLFNNLEVLHISENNNCSMIHLNPEVMEFIPNLKI